MITKICCWGDEIIDPFEIRRFDGIGLRLRNKQSVGLREEGALT
jgi:hypothetical protein